MSVYSRYTYNRNIIVHYVTVATLFRLLSLELYNLSIRMAMAQGRYKQEVRAELHFSRNERISLKLHFSRTAQLIAF